MLLTAWLVIHATRRLAAHGKTPVRNWQSVVVPIFIAILIELVTRFVDQEVNITGDLLITVRTIGDTLSVGFTAAKPVSFG